MRRHSDWAKNDWLDHPFWGATFRFFRFIRPALVLVGGLVFLRFAWSLGPFFFMMLLTGMVYLIMRYRWAVHDSSG